MFCISFFDHIRDGTVLKVEDEKDKETKKAKTPSAKTLARKAQEAALIAERRLLRSGSQRAWLKPEEVVIDGVKRDKFSIHGGAEYGSAGCIDLRHNAAVFFDARKYYLQNIPS